VHEGFVWCEELSEEHIVPPLKQYHSVLLFEYTITLISCLILIITHAPSNSTVFAKLTTSDGKLLLYHMRQIIRGGKLLQFITKA